MTEKVDPKALKQPKDIIAQDRNWTIRVNNELEAEQKWSNQWGFYEKGKLLLMQASLPRRQRQKRRRPSMIESSNSSRRSMKSMERFSIRLQRHMARATTSRSSRIANTTSMKITIYAHWNVGCRRAGKNQSGLLVQKILYSRGPLRPPQQDGQEEVRVIVTNLQISNH